MASENFSPNRSVSSSSSAKASIYSNSSSSSSSFSSSRSSTVPKRLFASEEAGSDILVPSSQERDVETSHEDKKKRTSENKSSDKDMVPETPPRDNLARELQVNQRKLERALGRIRADILENDAHSEVVKREDADFVDALLESDPDAFGDLYALRIKIDNLKRDLANSTSQPVPRALSQPVAPMSVDSSPAVVSSLSSSLNTAPVVSPALQQQQPQQEIRCGNHKYTDQHINTLLEIKIHQIGGMLPNASFRLQEINQADGVPVVVLVTPAVDTVEMASPINFYFDKAEQATPDAGGFDERKDVFDELGDLLNQSEDSYSPIRILFPYNITDVHWLTGEVMIKKTAHQYDISFIAHDPYGYGKFSQENAQKLYSTILKKIRELDPAASFHGKSYPSAYPRRQSQGDGTSCGPIMVEDLILRITGHDLTRALYPVGASELRISHIQLVKTMRDRGYNIGLSFINRHMLPAGASLSSSASTPKKSPSVSSRLFTPRAHGSEARISERSYGRTPVVGHSLVEIFRKQNRKFLGRDGGFHQTPAENCWVFALAKEINPRFYVTDFVGTPGQPSFAGAARGSYLIQVDDEHYTFVVMKDIDGSIADKLKTKYQHWKNFYEKFKENIDQMSNVQYVLVLMLREKINEDNVLSQIGQFLEKNSVSGFPNFQFCYPVGDAVTLSKIYTEQDAKAIFSPEKIKYQFARRPSDEELVLSVNDITEQYRALLTSEMQFVKDNPLYQLVQSGDDAQVPSYYLPMELENVRRHFNDLIPVVNNLLLLVRRKNRQQDLSDNDRELLSRIEKKLNEFIGKTNFYKDQLAKITSKYLGNEREQHAAMQAFDTYRGAIKDHFKTLAKNAFGGCDEQLLERWFDAHEFTALSCIRSLQTAGPFASSPKTIAADTAKLMLFYFYVSHPQVSLQQAAQANILIPRVTQNLLRVNGKESSIRSNFSGVMLSLRTGFNTAENRKENLSREIDQIGVAAVPAAVVSLRA